MLVNRDKSKTRPRHGIMDIPPFASRSFSSVASSFPGVISQEVFVIFGPSGPCTFLDFSCAFAIG